MNMPGRFQCHVVLLAALAAGLGKTAATSPGGEGSQPNVVLIMADDLGYSDLSCYGREDFVTPHCDRLADEGTRFTDMHSSAAVCTPSRYSVLTGRYAWRTWLKDWVVNARMPLLSEEAVGFIERHQDEPFFLYDSMAHVHSPLTPHPRFVGSSGAGLYGDFVKEMDWAVGKVLDTLDRLGLAENTLVIFTSDNGSVRQPSNEPWRGIKGEAYEGGHRVPFIARWPGEVPPGSVNGATLCQTDFMRACAELLGASLPDDAAEDSASFFAALKGEAPGSPRGPVAHHSVLGVFALRDGPWKLIDGVGGGRSHVAGKAGSVPFEIHLYAEEALPEVDPETGEIRPWSFGPILQEPGPGEPPGQLYNLENDPREQRNLWEERPEQVELLRRSLEALKGGNG